MEYFNEEGKPFDPHEDRHRDRFDASGRMMAACDDPQCSAYDPPNLDSLQELRDALAHWRSHSYLSGCSHGN